MAAMERLAWEAYGSSISEAVSLAEHDGPPFTTSSSHDAIAGVYRFSVSGTIEDQI